MLFSKYDGDPAHVEAMLTAFYRVCESLKLTPGSDDDMTELVAMKIVELAKEGETDLDRFCSRALMELDARSEEARSTKPEGV
jgi:hypothetical protein